MSTGGSESPQQFGKYQLLERIAVGGMAEIFRAKKLGAEGFEKELVIKRVLPHYSEDDAFITMFKDEARIAANLNHANICQVFEFDELDGSFYIAMEYIPGRDLKRVIDVGVKEDFPLTAGQVCWIGAQTAAGLHYAHTKEYNGQSLNIVHRDATPHNIMISLGGDVKLMDFGIAKAAARSTRTQAGTVKGKCAYMSPEQARGKELDGRSDVFALGIVMWECLARGRLFIGDTEFETLSNVLKKDIPSLRSVNPTVPKKLDEIILTALARDRDMRFESAAALERDLLGFFYAECDPSLVQLDAYMKHLFGDGPRPMLGDGTRGSVQVAAAPEPAPPPSGIAPTEAMPTLAEQEEDEPGTVITAAIDDSPTPVPPPPTEPLMVDVPPAPAHLRTGGSGPKTLPLDLGDVGLAATREELPGVPPAPPPPMAVSTEAPGPETEPIPLLDPASQITAYTGEIKGGLTAGKLSAIAAAVLLIVVGSVLMLSGEDSEEAGAAEAVEEPAAEAPAAKPPAAKLTMVRIETDPSAAIVYLHGLPLKTPFEVQRREGDLLKLRMVKRGYKLVNQRITVDAGDGDGKQLVQITLTKSE